MPNTIELIKQLREATRAGVQDCRKALERANGDYANALEVLHAQSEEMAAKQADRPALQGFVELYTHANGRVGVMVEVNTETDFAARSPVLREFAHEIALQVAAARPLFVKDEDIPAEVLSEESGKAAIRAREEGKPETIIPRITAGYLKKFIDNTVLLRQVSIRDEKTTVAQLLNQARAGVGENIVIRRFVRWEAGEGAEAV
jgi:elongation factor Ts